MSVAKKPQVQMSRSELEALLDAVTILIARGYFDDRDASGRLSRTALAGVAKLESILAMAPIDLSLKEDHEAA